MSKKTIRKSLAIGAGLALVSSAVAIAPASAAVTSMTLSPMAGSGTTSVLGATFNLKLLHVGGTTSDLVEYFVEGAVASDFASVKTDEGTDNTADTITDTTVTVTTVSSDLKTTNFSNAGLELNAGNYDYLSIQLDDSVVTANRTIKITPFLDSVVSDNKITSGEVVGNSIEVTFLKASTVTTTTVLTLAPLGSTSSSDYTTAVVTLGNSVNMVDTVGGVGKVAFKLNGGTAVDDTSVAYDATEGGYVAQVAANNSTLHSGDGLDNGDVISAQPFVEGETVGSTIVTSAASSGFVASLSALAAEETGFYLASDNSASPTTSNSVRVGDGTISVYTQVTAEAGYSKAGQTVTFKIAETGASTLDTAGSIATGGKTLKNTKTGSSTTAESISVTATSDASGYATVNLSYAGLKAGNTFAVTASAVGEDAASVTATFTVSPSNAMTLVSDVDGGDGSQAASYTLAKGAAGSVKFQLRDQFAKAPVGTFRSNVSISGGSMAALNQTVSFSSGDATVNWTDNNDAANSSVTIAMDVEKLGTDGTTWSDASESYTAVLVNVLASAITPNRVTVTNSVASTSEAALLNEAYVTGDQRLDRFSDAASWNTDASITANLSGVVYATTGGAVSGAKVTVTAPGVLFTNAAQTVYAKDSITVTADASGEWKVLYSSNIAGKVTFTVTSGSATNNTASTTFAAAAANTARAISFAGSDTNAASGSTFTVVGTLTDRWGNPVKVTSASTPKVTVSYSGKGIVFGSLPTTTDAKGQFSVSVLLGVNDKGTGTVTFSYDLDGDGSLTEVDGGNIVSSHVVTLGAPAASTTGKVNVGSFNGKLVVYAQNLDGKRISWKVGGNWGKATAVGNTLNRFDRPTPRRGVTVTVLLYVDGVLQLTKSVLTR